MKPRRTLRRFVLALSAALMLAGVASPALADDYDPDRAGHPLRIVAYIAHPIGVASRILPLPIRLTDETNGR